MQNFTFEAIGTKWQIDYHFQGTTLEIEKMVIDRVEEFDRNYSRFRKDSLVAQWAKKAGEYKLPADGERLFEFYKKLYDATGGLVTPLIGKTMEQAGYDAEYSLKSKKLTTPPNWEDTLEFTGWHPVNKKNIVKYAFPGPGPGKTKIIIKQPIILDFGAAGKGYLVDIIAHLLYTNGVDQFCIDAGGDMFMRDLPQTIGLEDPDDDQRILGTVEITNGALCASAGNRRKWKNFHHIINPKTLKPAEDVKATWVRAENTMLADGIATALFFVKPEILAKTFQFEYAMIENDDIKISQNFNAKLFTT